MPIAAAIRTHRRRARPARQSSAARRRPSRLPATAIAPVTNTWSYNRRRLPTAETQTPDSTRSWSLTYGYNAQGQRTSETAPDSVTTTYTVNALGQTTQISVKVKNATTTVASNASYYPNGALQQFTYGNGITHTLTQNARQLPQHSQDGSVLDLTTTFDENGNVATIVDGTANARQSRSMAYDGLDRLTQVLSPMFGTASYGYDEQDNLRHVGISGGSQPRDHTYCYSADNRLEFVRSGPNCTGTASPAVTALGYDVQGNLQYKNGTAYTFDYGNRLRNTAGRNYRYDAAGRRVRADNAGTQLQYSVYAGDGRLVWQRDEAAGKRINNIYLAGSLVAEVSRSLTTDVATYRYVHTDALGSPIAKTSSTGAVLETSEYEPYGALLNRANDDRAGYTGHVMDSASGLTYMQQRYLDPIIGRFLSVDPVTATSVGGNFNRYWYANSNPYKYIDPDGRYGKDSGKAGSQDQSGPTDTDNRRPNGCNRSRYCWQDNHGEWHVTSIPLSQNYVLYAVAIRRSPGHPAGHVFVGGFAPGKGPVAFGWYPKDSDGYLAALINGKGRGELRNDTGLFIDALGGDPNSAMHRFEVSREQYEIAMKTLTSYGHSNDYGLVTNNCVVAAYTALFNAGVTSDILVWLPAHPNAIYRAFKDAR